jgi:hypothetical protein
MTAPCAEGLRLASDRTASALWRRWGTYLPERQWATVREDYSPEGDPWRYFSYEDATARAYRWGEDGLLGFCDRQARLCFAIALWNGRDPILKERLFGLTGPEGNHGEDVKECYYYLANLPTHSYAKALYKYPQSEFPYALLRNENLRRSRHEREFEIDDTGVFDRDEYFDVQVEYAKAAEEDVLITITVTNRAAAEATVDVLPTVWFRNTWSWDPPQNRPQIAASGDTEVTTTHPQLGAFQFVWEDAPDLLFTDNITNAKRLFGVPDESPFVKDAFHQFVVHGDTRAINPARHGTKAAAHYQLRLGPHDSARLRMRLRRSATPRDPWTDFDDVLAARVRDWQIFSDRIGAHDEAARQCNASLLWTKQFYHFVVPAWIDGDPGQPKPPASRTRNRDWTHLYANDVLSMPDKWEYPWFAAWDLAFHMLPIADMDPDFAKHQLTLLLREWYMHPNGQLPAYEFNFGDVNPPVHAWAAWRVYKISDARGARDRRFLESVFQKLLLNFTWWVNRKDYDGNNLFQGGFLGLDNIGVFDRSSPLPTGGELQQADGTAWMGFYCLSMLSMAIELAQENPVYEDLASKFFEHFIGIADAMNAIGGCGLWDETDGFYYDQLKLDSRVVPLRTRSLVGLLPLIAVEVLEEEKLRRMPDFHRRLKWLIHHRPDLAKTIAWCRTCPSENQRILAIPSRDRLESVLRYVFDENEFLSPFGIRSLSRFHQKHPYVFHVNGDTHRVDYVPAESTSGLFGGNSNWRGPVWLPVNYLLIEALERYHHFYGTGLTVEVPTGSGNRITLREAAHCIARRNCALFETNTLGLRPCHGENTRYATDPAWKNLLLFHEYFDADSGRGLGASHQTGWTALVTRLWTRKVSG